MDTNEKIHIGLIKRLKVFSESYVPSKSQKSHKKTNSNDFSIKYPKIDLLQKTKDKKLSILTNSNAKYKLYDDKSQIKKDHKKNSFETTDLIAYSPDLRKIIKTNLNIISPKRKHRHHHENKLLTNNFNEKNESYKDISNKTQEKIIKKNLVNQKFKIADDFNEKNSNQFLNEKDKCLKKIILSDEIEEEEPIPFYDENEKGNKYELSSIKENEYNEYLNFEKVKGEKIKDDSVEFLSELIEDLTCKVK